VAAAYKSFDGDVAPGTSGVQVGGAERVGVDRHDARPAQLAELEQAGGPDRHRQGVLQLALEQHEEAAARRQGRRAGADQRRAGVDEGREQGPIEPVDDAPRRSARHRSMEHRHGQARGVADVA
jgi:hypothetical protein